MLTLIWLRGLVIRRAGRLAAISAGVAVAVALLASIGAFLASSKATMTRRAAANVAVDWQVEAQPGASSAAVLAATRRAPMVTRALPVQLASVAGFDATTNGTTQRTGSGVVLGLPDGYRTTFPAVVWNLLGDGRGVLVFQQTAANLRVAPGDVVRIARAGLPAVRVRVGSIVDLPSADSLFQKVGAPVGAQPQAPPDNVVLMPISEWHIMFDPLATRRPDLVHAQVHARLGRSLPNDPSAAYGRVTGAARHLEARLVGQGLVGDNLGATLAAARSDALYAQVLFLFLGVPGAFVAALLTAAVAGAGAGRRRWEQTTLRARGATAHTLVRVAAVEAGVVACLGALLGLGVAAVVGATAFGTVAFGASAGDAMFWGGSAVLVGVLIAAATVVVPAWRDARSATVSSGRAPIGRRGAPRWTRYGLDFLLLALATIVFWLTSRTGYQLVLAPEGTPSISVSYWALAGPALLWAGAALLSWRLASAALIRARGQVRGAARTIAGSLAGTVAASMVRQRRVISRSVMLVGLAVAFAASTAVFNSTYRAQAAVDARLTNGADVTVTQTPGSHSTPDLTRTITRVAGVRHVEPLQHRFAYVGADLQDLFGVQPATVVQATKLQDAYFQGGSARTLIRRLAHRPDGLLVSAETVRDYQLRTGDTINLRLQDPTTKQYRRVAFHYVGVVKEFPTAPRDSFLVANAAYVARQTGNAAGGTYLVDTAGRSPGRVASQLRTLMGTSAVVTDITSARKVVGSSLTAVDLAGLTRVELGFAIALAAASTGLLLALGFAERRRTFAITAALGARRRQLAGFVWTEALFVALGGLALGVLTGGVLAVMLVKVLTGVFDPPPSSLSIPWKYLGTVAAVTFSAVVVAAAATTRRVTSASITALREF